MNLYRPQHKYVFRPPKYSRWLAPFFYWLGETVFLKHKFKIQSVQTEGVEAVAELVRQGQSVLIAPNHADHADPSVLLSIGRRHNLRFHFMAAREGFEQSALQAFVLQRCGVFSVDREGADLAAIKTAIALLQQGRFPLVIFPEGEIWHHHERLDALNEGVTTILLRAAAKLPPGREAYLVPTAIHVTCSPRVQATFSDRLSRLETRVAWKPRPELPVPERIYRLGSGLLALKETEFLGLARQGDLIDRIQQLQNDLVTMIERRHHLAPPTSNPVPERIKNLRGRIRKQLTQSESVLSPQETTRLYDDLDTLFLASQLYSYPGQYLKEQPSVQRIAETLFKIEEDLLGQGHYVGPRQAKVRFGQPIAVASFLQEAALDAKSGVRPLTERLGNDLQGLLDNLIAPIRNTWKSAP